MNYKSDIIKMLCLFSCITLLIANEHMKTKECKSFKESQISVIKSYLNASEKYKNCILVKNKSCLKEKDLYKKTMNRMDKALNIK